MDNETKEVDNSHSFTCQPIEARMGSVDNRREFAGVEDTCQLYDFGRTYLYGLMKSGKIRSVLLRKCGAAVGKRLVELESVRKFIRDQAEQQTVYQAGRCNALKARGGSKCKK